MVNPDGFGMDDEAKPAQTKEPGQSDEKRRHLEIVNQTAHDSSGHGSETNRDRHGQERVESSLQQPGNQDSNEGHHRTNRKIYPTRQNHKRLTDGRDADEGLIA